MSHRLLRMQFLSVCALATIASAKDVNIKGRLIDASGKPIPLATVALKNTDLSTMSDENGNYHITGSTPIQADVIKPLNRSAQMVGNRLNFIVEQSRTVKVDLYSINGRHLGEVANENFSAGSYNLDPFKNGFGTGFYLLTYSDGVRQMSFKVVNTNSTTTHNVVPLKTGISSAPVSATEAETLDTLQITSKEGSEITAIPLMSLVDSLPTLYIEQRNISGKLTSAGSRGIGMITAELIEEGAEPKQMRLGYNKANSSYSGFVYSVISSGIKNYSVQIDIWSSDTTLSGSSKLVEFDSQLGDIDIPDFSPNNRQPQIALDLTTLGDTLAVSYQVSSQGSDVMNELETQLQWFVNSLPVKSDTVSSLSAAGVNLFQETAKWVPTAEQVAAGDLITMVATPIIKAPFLSRGVDGTKDLSMGNLPIPLALDMSIVHDNDSLFGAYRFFHADETVIEGESKIYWYRNAAQIDSNKMNIALPADLQYDDTIRFKVLPVALNGFHTEGSLTATELSFDYNLLSPKAADLAMTVVEDSLYLDYSFVGANAGVTEGETEIKWYRNGALFGSGAAVQIPSELVYTDTVRATVTPMAINGPLKTGIPASIEKSNIGRMKNVEEFLANSSSYDVNYRYAFADTLGARTTRTKGGLFDSWGTETQCQIAIPSEPFVTNGYELNYSAENAHHYWIGLAAAQELMGFDLQYLAGTALQETHAGSQFYSEAMSSDMIPPFNAVVITARDLCGNYEELFPKLGSSEFADYYSDASLSSPVMLSSMMVNLQIFAVMNSVHENSTKLYWDEAMAQLSDYRFGAAAVSSMWCYGLNGAMPTTADLLSVDNWESTAANSNASDLLNRPEYFKKVLPAVEALETAAKSSLTNSSVELMDFAISETELYGYFFGKNGSAEVQGEGGFLSHWHYESTDPVRQDIENELKQLFDSLKGKAPSVSGTEAVSFRYDFLFILRTLKRYLPYEIKVPTKGDAVHVITKYSK